jgi:L-lysine 2,3-aminomutase
VQRNEEVAMAKPNYIHDINRLTNLPEGERRKLKRVTRQFPFLANEYYLSLIDWSDPKDPLRRIVVPQAEEKSWRRGTGASSTPRTSTGTGSPPACSTNTARPP